MSDFRKLLLAFAAVTLIAGIASAGPAPALSTTAQPLTVRADVTGAIAPNIASLNTGQQTTLSALSAQAANKIAGTPANLNGITANTNESQSVAIVGNFGADSPALIVANAGRAFISTGNNAANTLASPPAQVARTAPTHAGNKAG